MCGRFAVDLPPELIGRMFGTQNATSNMPPNWNTAPSQKALAVRRQPQTGERHLDPLQWGLLPSWTKDPKAAQKPINARAETVAKLPTFRPPTPSAGRSCRRGRSTSGGVSRTSPKSRSPSPARTAPRWRWRGCGRAGRGRTGADGEVVRTFCLLTTEAKRPMQTVHHRMPVILEAEDWPLWLGEQDGDVNALLRPAADDVLRLWPISTAVNAVRNNGAELLEPLQAPDAPAPSPAPAGPNPA